MLYLASSVYMSKKEDSGIARRMKCCFWWHTSIFIWSWCVLHIQPTPLLHHSHRICIVYRVCCVFLWFNIYLFCLTAFSAFANLLPVLSFPLDAMHNTHRFYCMFAISFVRANEQPQCTQASKNWIDGNQLWVGFCVHDSVSECVFVCVCDIDAIPTVNLQQKQTK